MNQLTTPVGPGLLTPYLYTLLSAALSAIETRPDTWNEIEDAMGRMGVEPSPLSAKMIDIARQRLWEDHDVRKAKGTPP